MPIEEKNWTVKIQGSSHKRNTRKEFKHPEITEQLIYLYMYQEIQGCHRKYKPNTQVQ